ncbi:MAG: hypothetical protein JWP83_1364 [Mycobacterium sp.]|jgi:hypothetical protein|nr:hypothetical protein [Mycobacterium sp.]
MPHSENQELARIQNAAAVSLRSSLSSYRHIGVVGHRTLAATR